MKGFRPSVVSRWAVTTHRAWRCNKGYALYLEVNNYNPCMYTVASLTLTREIDSRNNNIQNCQNENWS